MSHFTSPSFWDRYRELPKRIQRLADKNFEILKENPAHPSLHLKKVKNYMSVRVGRRHRALAVRINRGFLWFWIGTHAEYDEFIR